jgi:hypothetical protein
MSNELKNYKYLIEKEKRAFQEEVQRKRDEKQRRKEFRQNNLVADKFLTIEKGRFFLQKKSVQRLMREARKKWGDIV